MRLIGHVILGLVALALHIRRVWTRVGDTFLQPKDRGQGIMTSEFLLPFSQLNLASLSPEKRDKVVEKCGLMFTKFVEIFEYKKKNDRYWNKAKLHYQVIKKALSIAEAFYPGYFFFFF